MPDWPIPVPVLTSKRAACSRSWWCHKAIIRLGNGYFGSVARARPHPTRMSEGSGARAPVDGQTAGAAILFLLVVADDDALFVSLSRHRPNCAGLICLRGGRRR